MLLFIVCNYNNFTKKKKKARANGGCLGSMRR